MKDPDKLALRSEAYADFLSGMTSSTVQTEYEVLHLMRQCTAQFGFTHFMIARIPFGEQQRFAERLVLSSWPSELVRQYDTATIFHASTLVERLCHTKLPIFGETAALLSGPANDVSGGAVAGLFADYPMRNTFAMMLHTTYGEAFAILLSGPRSEPERAETTDLYFTLLQLFETLERTFEVGSSARDKLSTREIECLRWAAAGKSSDEIAIILGISVYTVSSYFKTATRKLDSVNRMQAIARAMRMKLI
ncbi:MAG TPA: LuxR C-terminal-related transcriptional regulator [Pararhizobium sp.]|uniref:helix-turn-helix transcriptional regulator n=1 Tax=Pararhizobium sp. TaxID=1977563 RepID=UPI002CA382E0|nr:LuxR C-terminal-related transcriptional regulator [Pararhizobium sp.]HTO29608.1 LuxR C-terminal-related transcriptional regulator [Pararhizobium sp.]